MFLLIVKDAWHVPNVIQFNTGIEAINYGISQKSKNPNSLSIEVISRVNGSLIRKIK